jgi:hypothetical protein
MSGEGIDIEETLADCLLELDRLEQALAAVLTTNRELRERIVNLERRPTVSGVQWSRERDYTKGA